MKRALSVLVFVGCSGHGSSPVILPDAEPIDAAIDTPIDAPPPPPGATCNPLVQNCGAGQKCAWIEDSFSSGHSACVPNGTVGADQACTVGAPGPTGYSNCLAGTECVAGACKTICDAMGGAPMCDANHACSQYSGLFESNGTTIAGACDSKCDPLTQALLAGPQSAACGSPNPAMPNAGCFTFDGVSFTCSPVGPSTLPLTDRQPARGPASGGAYVNGCSPGFLPFFREQTGSNTIVCAGMCAPLKTDNTMPQNVSGSTAVPAKLPLEAAPAAGNAVCVTNRKGSEPGENCLFMWPFNVENGMLPPSPYNNGLGICFAPSHYTYDHDNNAGTPNRPVPSCASLPPKGTLANCTCDAMGNNCSGTACPDGQAHEWGCYNSTDSGQAFVNAAPHTRGALRDFRLGYGEGVGVRHAIR